MSDLASEVVPGLSAKVVHLWKIPLAESALQGIDLDLPELLAADELTRYRGISHPRARSEFLRSRVALRLVLASYLECQASTISFSYNEYGKPELAENKMLNLHFNLSHSGDYCVLAVTTEHEVGIDIERCHAGRDYTALAQRFFSTAEHQLLESKADEVLFYQMWVLKEAAVKSMGIRLLAGLDRFECFIMPGGSLGIKDRLQQPGAPDWSIYQWQPDLDAVAAVVVRNSSAAFIKRNLQDIFPLAQQAGRRIEPA